MSESKSRTMDETVSAVEEKAREGAAAATDAARNVADKARAAANSARERIAESADWEAGAEMVDEAAGYVSDAADYVRSSDPQELWADFTALVRSKPLQSLAVAAVLGFVAGRAIRRR